MDLSHLNEAQKQAVINTEGPYMIVAGAGSGKTSVLTHRIAYLLKEKQADPFGILALTFTNKSAQEMRQRIEKMVGTEAKNLWLGTFHSIFVRILHKEANYIGYPSNFTIYDAADSKSLLRNIIKEMNLDDKIYKPGVVLARISGAKNQLVSAQAYINNPTYQTEDENACKSRLGEVFLKYVDRCLKAGAMDFDDLLFNTYQLFRQQPDLLHKYQQRFRYILIDEFQDTNMAQYIIVKKLAMQHKNICVVGDDAQSIYAFRGANIQNIFTLEKDYPDLKVTKLEQNYRSTQSIVHAANSIISHNRAQLKKKVWTDNTVGEPLGLVRAATDAEEGRLVAASIFEIRANQQLPNSSFAVLYRTNNQSRAIEEALRKLDLPYRIVGGMSFYERMEVKDLLAYLRLLVNHNDEEALRRIINLPKRGIGLSSVDKMVLAATDNAISLWEVVCNASKFLPHRTAKSIEGFATMIRQIAGNLAKKDAHEIASNIAQRSGLLKMLQEDRTIEGIGRLANVQELLNSTKEFTTRPEQEDRSLAAFLQEIALMTRVDDPTKETTDHVTLMTIHAAKGLEFAYVYIIGMEEELFPSQLMLESQADLEEERRLFYVAVTRAQQKVILTYALSRYRFGRLKHSEPSRFLAEVDPAYLHLINAPRPTQTTDSTAYAHRLVRSNHHPSQTPLSRHLYTTTKEPFQPIDMTRLEVGAQVKHPKFGTGKVLHLDRTGSYRKAKIDFTTFGEKTLLLRFAKLDVLRSPS